MSQILENGRSIRTDILQRDCKVEKLLGRGGQGEVYQVTLSGQPMALKWYYPVSATLEQRLGLEMLVKRGVPDIRFLWPVDLAASPGSAGFGYIMPLRPERYKSINDLVMFRVKASYRVLATGGASLADGFYRLHSAGLCYRDISFGNVFFDPQTGDVLICDNDNVSEDGAAPSYVVGTQRFMAPEIVRGEARPSTQTDLYSLAVLLFYMLVNHHPLDGKQETAIHCSDDAAMNFLYGTNPIFIFDPNDRSNEPLHGYHDNALIRWPILPRFVRDMFTRAFTVGLRASAARVRESEWIDALVQLRDAIFPCTWCGRSTFFDIAAYQEAGDTPASCWSCRQRLVLPARIQFNKTFVMLNADTKLYPHHIDAKQWNNFTQPIGDVVQHPSKPDLWGIRNQSEYTWTSTAAAGAIYDIPPGRSFTLSAGARINFGPSTGKICL